MFDLLEPMISFSSQRLDHCWMCVECRTIFDVKCACAVCGADNFVPYVDRRPLLLSKEVRNAVVNLIDEIADTLSDLDLDSQCFYTSEYMPFLSGLLDEAARASEVRKSGSTGYRTTSLSVEELLPLFRSMKKPFR